MKDILITLKDTPLPSILAIGGIALLILSFLQKASGGFEPSQNKGLMRAFGMALLICGVVISMASSSQPPIASTPMPAATNTAILLPSSTAKTVEATQPPTPTYTPQPVMQVSTSIPQSTASVATDVSSIDEFCTDWEQCWEYDDQAKTMTWKGPGDVHIGQEGASLQKIRQGYTAIFTTTIAMTVEICKGYLDKKLIAKNCTPQLQLIRIEPGLHTVLSPLSEGGFGARPN